MSYPAISLATATVGRHRCPQKRLQTARQPPVYTNSSPDHRACNSLTPSAVLTPSIPVHRWIRVKSSTGKLQDSDCRTRGQWSSGDGTAGPLLLRCLSAPEGFDCHVACRDIRRLSRLRCRPSRRHARRPHRAGLRLPCRCTIGRYASAMGAPTWPRTSTGPRPAYGPRPVFTLRAWPVRLPTLCDSDATSAHTRHGTSSAKGHSASIVTNSPHTV